MEFYFELFELAEFLESLLKAWEQVHTVLELMAKNDFMQNSCSVSTSQLVGFGLWIASADIQILRLNLESQERIIPVKHLLLN